MDLATGNLTGTFDVEKMALFPYRFFLPAAVGTSKLSALEDAHVGFAFAADVRQFSVWGRGRLSELALVSPRVSARPIEHVTFDVALGDGPGSGLLFDLNQNRLTTAGPLVLSAGALKRLEIGFAVDSSVPD